MSLKQTKKHKKSTRRTSTMPPGNERKSALNIYCTKNWEPDSPGTTIKFSAHSHIFCTSNNTAHLRRQRRRTESGCLRKCWATEQGKREETRQPVQQTRMGADQVSRVEVELRNLGTWKEEKRVASPERNGISVVGPSCLATPTREEKQERPQTIWCERGSNKAIAQGTIQRSSCA